ncbi:glycosyl hydrolase [Planomonospora sp. ID91781]|nr:glycosyl hydrolase [Planomonospora sp. ID91781]
MVITVAGVLVMRSQDGSGSGGGAASEAFGHVHGMVVDPGTGVPYVATHVGLFRLTDTGTAVRVSQNTSDLMGFTAAGPGRFLASGHPGEHDDGPSDLGLIESTDGGVTWTTMSLPGAADFHGLQAAHGLVYGYNSADGAFLVSSDRRTWQQRSTIAVGAFAVSPADAQTILAIGRDGVGRSTDGGRTWYLVPDAPALATLAWNQADQAWGAAPDGTVWRSGDGGTTWQRRGTLGGPAHALTAHQGTVLAALDGDRVVASADGGITWTTRYAPR